MGAGLAAERKKESLSADGADPHRIDGGPGPGGLRVDPLFPHGHVRQRKIPGPVPAAPVRHGQLRPGHFQPGAGRGGHHLLHQRRHRVHRRGGGHPGGGLYRLFRRLAGRGADARQRRGDGVPQHPAGAGVHLAAGVRQVQRDPGPGRRLCAQLCPGHPQRICPAPGDELCQKRPAHGSGASAHYVSAYSAQHPAGAPADAGDRV